MKQIYLLRYLGWFLSMSASFTTESISESPNHSQIPNIIINNDLTNWTIFCGKNANLTSDTKDVKNCFAESIKTVDIPGIKGQSLTVNYSTFDFWNSNIYSLGDHDRFLRTLKYFEPPLHNDGYPGRDESAMRRFMESGQSFVGLYLNNTLYNNHQFKILEFRVNDAHYNYMYKIYRDYSKSNVLVDAQQGFSPLCDSSAVSAVDFIESWAQTSFTGYFDAFNTGNIDPKLDNKCANTTCISSLQIKRDCQDSSCVLRNQTSRCPTVTLNFKAESVRNFKKIQILDLLEKFRPAAIELDFNRFPQYFSQDYNFEKRSEVISSWLYDLRRSIDNLYPGTLLGIRIPSKKEHRDIIGIDLLDINSKKTADYAILGNPYFADQIWNTEIQPSKFSIALYAEVTHESGAPKPPNLALEKVDLAMSKEYIEAPVTSRQITTSAYLAKVRGFAGFALFNTHYYLRPSSNVPGWDIPQEAIKCTASIECMSTKDQEYMLSSAHYNLPSTNDMLPIQIGKEKPARHLTIQVARPPKGWTGKGLLAVSISPESAEKTDIFQDLNSAAEKTNFRVNGKKAILSSYTAWPFDAQDGASMNEHLRKLWYMNKPFFHIYEFDVAAIQSGNLDLEIDSDYDGPKTRIISMKMYMKNASN